MSSTSPKIVEATIAEFGKMRMETSMSYLETIFSQKFFDQDRYMTINETLNIYLHSIVQNEQARFFESKGLKIVEEVDADLFNSPPVMERIKIGKDEWKTVYSRATICYKSDKGKVMVVVERDEYGEKSVNYRIRATEQYTDLLNEWMSYSRKNNFFKGKKITAGGEFLEIPDITWDDLILPVETKKLLKSLVNRSAKKTEIYKKNGLNMKCGIMLSGRPGCGKSTAIKIVVKECPWTVIVAQPANLNNSAEVRTVCSMARDLSPCVLIIEDIDWIAEDRNTGDAGRVIELMNQLDGLESFANVITIATTNDLDKIEGAIKNRPGRFDRVLTIDNPDEVCRKQMIDHFTRQWKKEKDIDYDVILKATTGLSGAHMSDLCQTAAKQAEEDGSVDENDLIIICSRHFDRAIKEVFNKDYTTYMQSAQQANKGRVAGFSASLRH